MKTTFRPCAFRSFVAALALAASALCSGCVAVVVGAALGAGAAVAYSRGTLTAWLDAGFDKTLAATHRAVQELGFAKIGEETEGVLTTVTVRTNTDKKIEITLGRGGDRLTHVEIRAGLLGDEALSRAVLDKIKAAL